MGAVAKDGSSAQDELASTRCMREPLLHQAITHLRRRKKHWVIPCGTKWAETSRQKPKWLQIMGLRFHQNSGIPLGGVWSQHGVCSQLLSKWEGRNKKEVNVTCTHLGSPNPTQGNVTPNTLSSFQSGRYIPLWFQYNSHNLLLPSLT